MAAKESQVQAEILTALKQLGIFAWRNNNTATYDQRLGIYRSFTGIKGVPDILAILPGGQFCGIEVKANCGVQSSDQILFQKQCEALGGRYILARSVDDVMCLTTKSTV